MTINDLLKGYINDNIKPKKEENDKIQELYSSVNWIKELLKQNWYYCFRSWSYARWTAINPINDLDIICECDENDIQDFINSEKWKWLFKIISDKYSDKYEVNFQSSSIWISFWPNDDDFWIDIVVALKDEQINNYWDNLYKVPKLLYKTRKERREIYKNIKENWIDKEYLTLIKSDPKWYKKELKEIKDLNDNIVYATRFLKKWKCIIKDAYYWENEKCFKSFHIEEVVKKTIKWNMSLELLDLLKETINNFDLSKANIPDRADKEIMIDSYIDTNNFNKIKWQNLLNNILNELSILNENNFEYIINKIFLLKKEKKEVKIDTKQNSYYAIK